MLQIIFSKTLPFQNLTSVAHIFKSKIHPKKLVGILMQYNITYRKFLGQFQISNCLTDPICRNDFQFLCQQYFFYIVATYFTDGALKQNPQQSF